MLKRAVLEALHKLSLAMGTTLDLEHECRVFMEWLEAFIRPKAAVLFLADEKKQNLMVAGCINSKLPENVLPLGADPWEWLKEQGLKLPRDKARRDLALPIIIEDELFGLLAYISRRRRQALEEERRLVNLALNYVAPIFRNIYRYQNIEKLVEKKTAELRLSEERHRYISELISDYAYCFRVTPEGKLKGEWLSESFIRIFGLTTREFEEQGGWQSVVHPADLPAAVIHADKVLLGQPDVCGLRFVTHDGQVRWIRDFARPVMDEKTGRVVRIYGAIQDITERKKREEVLERQLKELRTLWAFGKLCDAATDEESLVAEFMKLIGQTFFKEDFGLYLMDEAAQGLRLYQYFRMSKGLAIDFIPLGKGVVGQVAIEGKPKRVSHVGEEKNYIPANPNTLSELAVPVKVGERVIGVINTESRIPDYFSAEDERLLSTVASQLGSVLERIRLERETHKRLAELEAINKITMALRQAEKTEEALLILLTEILSLFGLENGAIYLFEPPRQELRMTISRGWLTSLAGEVIKPGEGIVGHVFSTGKAYHCFDLSRDALVLKPKGVSFPEGWQAAAVPIMFSQEPLGVIFISSPAVRPITREEVEVLSSAAEIAAIALHRLRLHEETERRLGYLQALRTINLAISAATELRLLIDILIENAIFHLKVDAAAIFLFNSAFNYFAFARGQGFWTETVNNVIFRPDEGFMGRAVLEKRLLNLREDGLSEEPEIIRRFWKQEKFSTAYAAGLVAKGDIKGVLTIWHRHDFEPQKEWLDFFEALSVQIAIAISDAQLFEELQRANFELTAAYDATIEGWVRTLDLRDRETENHTLRVTEMTLEIARRIGLSAELLVHYRRGAILHDIGKIAVPDYILFKPGPLEEQEWAIIRQHPQLAFEILYPIKFLRPALDIPYCHHERWNGTGYPRGLKGEEIPLAARIFAVADVYDALTSDRPYRPAWSKEEAIKYIEENSGQLFDPKVVAIFLELIRSKE
ncbi:MAG: GAF domain-containing protein [Candidatus Aminicenantales bacterium]